MRDFQLIEKLAQTFPNDAMIQDLYRERLEQRAKRRQKNHHRTRPGGLRARRAERQARYAQGYCPHGVYVGGLGADYMCGHCEQAEHSPYLTKSERVNLDKRFGQEG